MIVPLVEQNPNLKLEVFQTECAADRARTGVDDLLSRYGKDSLLGVWSIEGTGAVGGIIPALESAGLIFPPDDPKHIPWYQLPIVEIPKDIPPDSPESWPNQIEGKGEGAFVQPKFGRHRGHHHA